MARSGTMRRWGASPQSGGAVTVTHLEMKHTKGGEPVTRHRDEKCAGGRRRGRAVLLRNFRDERSAELEASQERIVMCSKLHRQLTYGSCNVRPVSGSTVVAGMRIPKRKSRVPSGVGYLFRPRPTVGVLARTLRTGFETDLVPGSTRSTADGVGPKTYTN
jgi:hypothetical protein